MPNYRRNYVPGGTYFFTVVTHRRRPILTSSLARKCLREAIRTVREERPFELIAIILLPDHLHAVWTLPREDDDYSTRWSHLKAEFTRSYLSSGGTEAGRSDSRVHQGERGIWQRRFWEHTCEDEADLKRLVNTSTGTRASIIWFSGSRIIGGPHFTGLCVSASMTKSGAALTRARIGMIPNGSNESVANTRTTA